MILRSWDYLQRVQQMLARISVANGFHTNIGANITLEPAQMEFDGPHRICVVLDTYRAPEDPGLRNVGRQLVVAVIGQVRAGLDDTQFTMNQVMADIDMAMEDMDQWRAVSTGLDAAMPRFIEATVIPPAEGLDWTGAAARYACAMQFRRTPTSPIT